MKKHGHSYGKTYKSWISMKSRCLCKTDKDFENYGARGIEICDRWKNSFENFLNDMGERPETSHSLDRIDNTKGYSPDNCRWATKKQQATNRRPPKKRKGSTNMYRGVSKFRNKWVVNCASKWVGTFKSELEAAKAYNLVAIQIFGDAAILNNLEEK